ncbi:MAG: hypothetical protein RL385_4989 [Pseudomonadota bacterium]
MPFVRLCQSRCGRLWLALCAALLCAPSLSVGLLLDDYFLLSRLRDADGGLRWLGLRDAFAFFPRGEAASLQQQGLLGWWVDPQVALSFFRPLSALSHALDFQWLTDAPWLMHAESIALMLALHLSVGQLYARWFGAAPRALALAYLLYILSPGHAVVASWLANRNACLAALFGVWALWSFERAAQGKGARYHGATCLGLLLSLLSGELGTSTFVLLAAHAWCIDAAPWPVRLRALLAPLLLLASWLVVYRALGFGTAHVQLYLDAVAAPWDFVCALGLRAPQLIFAQLYLPIASLSLMLSGKASLVASLVCGCAIAPWLPSVLEVCRHDARARFCAAASLGSLLPIAASVPHDRLLLFADIGGAGLIASLVHHLSSMPSRRARVLRLSVASHLGASLLLGPAYAASLHAQAATADVPFRALKDEEALANQTLVFVNLPSCYFAANFDWQLRGSGRPSPQRMLCLAPGIYPLRVARMDAHTLRVRASHGVLQPWGTWRGDSGTEAGPLSAVYMAQALNLEGDARPLSRGETLRVGHVSVTAHAWTPEGYPSEVHFRFDAPLDSPSLRFVAWQGRALLPFTLPKVGEEVALLPILL